MKNGHHITHWIRILPNGDREIWSAKPEGAPPHPSDISAGCTCHTTWWAPLTEPALLEAVATFGGAEPCRCIAVKREDGIFAQAEEVVMSNTMSGRPFMALFSWTMGLDWELPIELKTEDGRLRATGKLLARAKDADLTEDKARRELRLNMY